MAERLAALGPVSKARTTDDYAPGAQSAVFGSRLLAYAIDSVALFFLWMLFFTIGGAIIFFNSDSGASSASDSSIWTAVVVIMMTVPVWFLLNLALTLRRRQTIGQYVIGLTTVRENGDAPSTGRVLGYWLALHPLLFHPVLSSCWLLLAWVSISVATQGTAFIVCLAVALVCLVAPLANFLFAFTDADRRTIHDRIAGLRVVRFV